jgi:Xaa-Pro dipeptidase
LPPSEAGSPRPTPAADGPAGAALRVRQARTAEWMARNGVYAAVLDDFENQRSATVRWLSGHPMDALLFLFSSGKTVLVPWDVNIARERSVVGSIVPYTDFRRSFKEAVTTVLRENGVEAAVGGPRARRKVEFPSRTPHLRFLELTEELPGAEILLRQEGFEYFVARSRAVKDGAEVAAIEKAAAITNELIDLVIDHVESRARQDHRREELREIDLAMLIEREALLRGAEGLGFETLAAGPARSWAIHPFPASSAGPFGGDGFSILDFGVKVEGYTSDVTITFAVGSLSPEQDRMLGLVEDAYHAAMEAARPGVSPQEPARKAEKVFSAAGQNMPHALGHGIGLDTHEAPLLRSQGENPDPALLPGMVVTIEPGLYDPRQGGVRWENDVLIGESSSRTLTNSRIVRIR